MKSKLLIIIKFFILNIFLSYINTSISNILKYGSDIYLYSFPLIKMELTKKLLSDKINTFAHKTDLPNPNFHDVVRPNLDTLYSSAWLDLSNSPVIVEVPDTNERYYVIQAIDAWTNSFSSIGSRTTGTKKNKFVFTGPFYKGNLPDELKDKEIKSPTNMVWLLGRIQVNGKNDIENVIKIQEGLKLQELNKNF